MGEPRRPVRSERNHRGAGLVEAWDVFCAVRRDHMDDTSMAVAGAHASSNASALIALFSSNGVVRWSTPMATAALGLEAPTSNNLRRGSDGSRVPMR